jgi:rRNA processing protein Gar1
MSSSGTAKRSHERLAKPEEEDDDVVDDLMFAATFAVVVPPGVAVPGTAPLAATVAIKDDDDNEIAVEEDDDGDESDDEASDPDKATRKDASESDDESDDDEDLKEALERMEDIDEEEDPVIGSKSGPKTENEVDGYKVPIQELETKLQLKLTVDHGRGSALATALDPKQVSVAGTIRNFMMEDRTVVVESVMPSPTTSWQQQTGPLDEGSLLVMQVPASVLSDNSDNSDNGNNSQATEYVPLGRIFEVFGPVSRPLYTIRLPSPNDDSSADKTKPTNGRKNKKVGPKVGSSLDDAKSGSDESVRKETGTEEEAKIIEDPLEQKSEEVTGTIGENEKLNNIPRSDDDDTEIKSTTVQESETIKNLWATDGALTKYISQHSGLQVFYVQDEAKLIDTGLVLRSSGKGCDASNLYDEEVMNSNEMYYSDDEKEREAKNKRKGSRRKEGENKNAQSRNGNRSRQQQHGNQRYHAGTSIPQGFHSMSQQPQQMPFYPQPVGIPSGFHHQTLSSNAFPPPPLPPPCGGHPPPYYPQQHLQQTCPAGMVPPLPRPPPPPYPGTGNVQIGNQPPPPPPPRNPNEPPAYQY